MAKKKGHRKTIRIGGQVLNSPRYYGKDGKMQSEQWYAEKLREKDFLEKGLLSSSVPTFVVYAAKWFKERAAKHPKSTTDADDVHLRKYLLPYLADRPMDRITRTLMRDVLKKAQTEHGISIATRTRIKATASKMFSDALNENPPLCTLNPCQGLKFSDPRTGEKLPATLQDQGEVLAFLQTAAEFGPQVALICAIAVMAGLRKSEIIPLKYRNVKAQSAVITVESHCEQASLSIKPGTKSGNNETREVFVSADLIRLIEAFKKDATFSGDDDFIFCDESGDWIRPRKMHAMIDQVVKAFGRPITLHKLRHSYGRIFTARTGNLRALQELLGHKSATTTQLYSKLSGSQLKPFGEVMNFFSETPSTTHRVTPKRHHKAKLIK